MTWIAVSLALASQAPAPSTPWRLVQHPWHLGARPALYVDSTGVGIGATLQATAWWLTL